jgi:hypothetical protein
MRERDGVGDRAAWPLKRSLGRSRSRDGVDDVADVVYVVGKSRGGMGRCLVEIGMRKEEASTLIFLSANTSACVVNFLSQTSTSHQCGGIDVGNMRGLFVFAYIHCAHPFDIQAVRIVARRALGVVGELDAQKSKSSVASPREEEPFRCPEIKTKSDWSRAPEVKHKKVESWTKKYAMSKLNGVSA